jgi:hypothetical protein
LNAELILGDGVHLSLEEQWVVMVHGTVVVGWGDELANTPNMLLLLSLAYAEPSTTDLINWKFKGDGKEAATYRDGHVAATNANGDAIIWTEANRKTRKIKATNLTDPVLGPDGSLVVFRPNKGLAAFNPQTGEPVADIVVDHLIAVDVGREQVGVCTATGWTFWTPGQPLTPVHGPIGCYDIKLVDIAGRTTTSTPAV